MEDSSINGPLAWLDDQIARHHIRNSGPEGEFFRIEAKYPYTVRKSKFDTYNSTIGMIFEEDIREQFLYPHIEKDMLFVDAGACFGNYALPALAAGAKIIAFEPHPQIYLDLIENVKLNNRVDGRAFISNGALLARECMMSLGELENVPAIRLDILNIKPDFIKIDVEGCELFVIKGALKTLKTHHPKVLVEHHLKLAPPHTETEIIKQMDDIGYKRLTGPRTEELSYSFFSY